MTSGSIPSTAAPVVRREGTSVARGLWIAFHVLLLTFALAYIVTGLGLEFVAHTGGPGAGFFPRTIGILLAVSSVYALVANWRRVDPAGEREHYPAVVAFFVGSGLFVLSLSVLGTWIGVTAFLFASLTMLNPRRYVVNVSLSLLIPLGFYLLFELWLGATLPEGLLLGAR